jgi:hypothetical protein
MFGIAAVFADIPQFLRPVNPAGGTTDAIGSAFTGEGVYACN